jgi:hypothetical protein
VPQRVHARQSFIGVVAQPRASSAAMRRALSSALTGRGQFPRSDPQSPHQRSRFISRHSSSTIHHHHPGGTMNVQCSQGHDNIAGSAFCSTCGQSLAAAQAPEGVSSGATPEVPPTAAPQPAAPLANPYAVADDAPVGPPPGVSYAGPAAIGSHLGGPVASPARSKNLLIGGGIAAAVLALVGVGVAFALVGEDDGGSATANGKTLRGISILVDSDGGVEGSWDDCQGTEGYDDFGTGMRLSVKGASDEIVGTGDVVNVTEENIEDVVRAEFDSGDEQPIGLDATTEKAGVEELRDLLEETEGFLCLLYFEANIEASDYYAVELASRGDLSFSRAELADQGYVVGVSLGD